MVLHQARPQPRPSSLLLPWREALERIEQEGSELQGLVAVWAVVNRIALCSVPDSDLPILHYEQAVRDPWQALSQLSNHGYIYHRQRILSYFR